MYVNDDGSMVNSEQMNLRTVEGKVHLILVQTKLTKQVRTQMRVGMKKEGKEGGLIGLLIKILTICLEIWKTVHSYHTE